MRIEQPKQIRERCLEFAGRPAEEPNSNRRGPLVGHMADMLEQIPERLTEDTDVDRRLVLGFCFGDGAKPLQEKSSNDLTPAEVNGLWDWIGPRKVGDVWTVQKSFAFELSLVVTRARFIVENFDGAEDTSLDEMMDQYPEYFGDVDDVEDDGMVADATRFLGGEARIATRGPLPERTLNGEISYPKLPGQYSVPGAPTPEELAIEKKPDLAQKAAVKPADGYFEF